MKTQSTLVPAITNPDMKGKSQKLIDVVTYLRTKYGTHNIRLKDHWDSDKDAIGLTDKTGKFLVYISGVPENPQDFYVSLENLPDDDELPYSPAGDFHNIKLAEVEELLTKHLQIDKL